MEIRDIRETSKEILKQFPELRERNRYNFPSGEKTPFSMTEIEGKYLGRKSKVRKVRWLYWLVIAFGILIIAAVLYRINSPIVKTANAKEFPGKVQVSYKGKNFTPGSFCAQAVLDHASWGRDISQDLKDYCELN